MLNPELQDQIAIVTGANSGIGATVAKVLAEQGVHVAIHYHPGMPDEGALHTLMGEQAAIRLAEESQRNWWPLLPDPSRSGEWERLRISLTGSYSSAPDRLRGSPGR